MIKMCLIMFNLPAPGLETRSSMFEKIFQKGDHKQQTTSQISLPYM